VAFFSGDGAYATDGLRLTALALNIRGNVHPRAVRTKKSSTFTRLLIGVDYTDNTTLRRDLLDQHASRYLLAMLPPGLRELSRSK